jgi:hypothetical protein
VLATYQYCHVSDEELGEFLVNAVKRVFCTSQTGLVCNSLKDKCAVGFTHWLE